jgi:hypothetical protein
MISKSLMATALLVIGAIPSVPAAIAQEGAGKPKPGSAADPSKKVCRNLVLTGSRMTKRFCRTQAEWDQSAAKAQDFLRDGQTDGYRRDGEMNGQGMVNGPR